MKIKKSQLKELIKEELKNANHIAERILREGSVLKNKNRMLPSEWEQFIDKFTAQNKGYKVVTGNSGGTRFEAIVDKSNPREAIVKYIPSDMDAYHDMDSSEFFKYLR